jgi:hypothetical protein
MIGLTSNELLTEASELLPRAEMIHRADGFQLTGKRKLTFIAYRPFIPALADAGVMDYFWQHSRPESYIPRGATDKWAEVVSLLSRNTLIRMPLVNVYELGKLRVVFISGQYLFALMRDLGFGAIPVMLTKQSEALFDRYIRATCEQPRAEVSFAAGQRI